MIVTVVYKVRIGREFLGLEYGFFMHEIHIYLKEMLFLEPQWQSLLRYVVHDCCSSLISSPFLS